MGLTTIGQLLGTARNRRQLIPTHAKTELFDIAYSLTSLHNHAPPFACNILTDATEMNLFQAESLALVVCNASVCPSVTETTHVA